MNILTSLGQAPPAWTAEAECTLDPEGMFLTTEIGVEQAKAVCHACPVLHDCREWAIAHAEPWGIWGALTPEERLTERARRRLETEGLPTNPDNPGPDHVRALADEDFNDTEIAAHLALGRKAVSRMRADHAIPAGAGPAGRRRGRK